MADRIKGLTIVLGADSSELTKAIYSVNQAMAKTQANLRDINKALKFDPKNTDLLKDKQTELTKAIDDTKTKIAEEEKALQALKNAGVDETSQEFRDLKTQLDIDKSSLKGLEDQMKNFGSVGQQVIKAVGQEIKAVGDKMQIVGNKIADVGTSLTTKVTVPIVAAGTAAVSKFAEVDKTMALTNKTMNNSAEQADLLNKAMESAASNSIFGMNDAANATLNFARAGLTAEEAASALAPAMNLAAGEAGDLDVVSGGLVATINGFGDDFTSAGHYADVFAAACNNSALDVNTLSESMSVAAPIFNTAGKSVEDAALMLGVMANAGIDANVAANSLKTGMARLAEPTKQAREAMEKYGISMDAVWNADGSMKDMTVIQQNLNKAFSELSEQEQMAAAGAIFGKNQMSAWLAVINTAPSDVNDLAKSIEGAKGTTDEMSTAMMEGFGGSIEKLKSSLDVLMTSLGKIIAEYLTPVIEKIQGVVDKFMALDDETKKHIVQIAGIVAAVGPVLLIVGKVIVGIGSVISAVGTITTAISAAIPIITGIAGVLTGTVIPAIAAVIVPIWPIVAAIATVIAIIVVCIKHWDQIKEAAQHAVEFISEKWNAFKETMAATWESVKTATSNAADSMADKWSNFKESTSQKWNDLSDRVKRINTLMARIAIEKFVEIHNGVSNKVNELKANALNAFNNLKSGIASIIGTIYTTIVNGFQKAISFITSLPSRALGWGRDIINGVINGIKNAIGGLVNAMSDVANTIARFIHFSEPDEGPLSNFHTYMPDMMRQIAQGIRAGIPMVESAMDSMANTMLPSFGSASGTASAGTTNNNTSNSVSINVYGSAGQDVNELANIIEQKITDNVVRRGVAFS